jgi:sterol desaturase/sphingolipid hydroxylase (fatty acid hydroxylase superfamily)
MEAYAQALNIAIPVFLLLILLEEIAARWLGQHVNRGADAISSLSSGITNIVKDVLGLSIVIISYQWLLGKVAVVQLESTWLLYLVAFVAKDFAGYWIHRLEHRVNFLWNRHIIHHSSEEFNLSCALRQSISSVFSYFSFFMLPAALLGVPSEVIAVVAPIQLFAQFWYHTRLIGRMGFLEHLIVTPSHHRVHHAINPEYLDKNFGQIFILWDKLFGTFQPELATVPPVYGVKRPVNTWNPLLINFQHFWLQLSDAWHAENLLDKLRIWVMPTGWRPADVAEKFPVKTIGEDLYQYRKHDSAPGRLLLGWSWLQLAATLALMLYLFQRIAAVSFPDLLLYGAFLFLSVFCFTSQLDKSRWALFSEALRTIFGLALLWMQGGSWFGLDAALSAAVLAYLLASLAMSVWLSKKESPISRLLRQYAVVWLLLASSGDALAQVVLSLESPLDDVEERSDGSIYTNSSDLELVTDGDWQVVGLRFSNVPIPQGMLIQGAWLQFTTDEISTGACNLEIRAQAANSAPAFEETYKNISARELTNATVSWQPEDWNLIGQSGLPQRSPDLSVLLQEVVNRPGWVPGSALALVIKGSGRRTAQAMEGNPTMAARLVVELGIDEPTEPYSQLFINEIMPANGLYPDEFGETDDWLELYNGGNEIVNLEGLYLSDEVSIPKKWKIAGSKWVSPGSFALLWMDGDAGQGPFHAPFKLSSQGEVITLSQEINGQLYTLDALDLPATLLNISRGRREDGQAEWVFFREASPNATNNGRGRYEELMVSFSLPGGLHSAPVALELFCPDSGATIHYTLDGSAPDSSSPVYSQPIPLNQATAVSARALKPGNIAGKTYVEQYLVGASHTLPVVCIQTEPENLWNLASGIYVTGTHGVPGYCSEDPRNWNQDWEKPASIALYEPNGAKAFQVNAGIKIGGGCSRGFRMKSFNVYLRGDKYGDEAIDYPVFPDLDIQQFKRLKIRNAGNDFEQMHFRDGLNQTLLRNTVDLDLMGYRPAVLYLNGQYWGVYEIRELYNEDYIASHFNLPNAEFDIITNPTQGAWAEVNEGDYAAFQHLKSFIEQRNLSIPANYEYLLPLMDMEEYLNYHIAQIYLGNYDWPANNVRVWRNRNGGKFRWMLYDLDATTNYGWWSKSSATYNTLQHALALNGDYWPNGPQSTLFLRKLMENQTFRHEFIQRTATFRELIFHPERVNPMVDSIRQLLLPEMQQHILRWSVNIPAWGWGWPAGGSLQSWEGFINNFRAFFSSRRQTIIYHFRETLQTEGTYPLSFNYPEDTPGDIFIHSCDIKIPHNYTADYFKKIPLRIKAVPKPGYRFIKWLETGQTSPEIAFTASQPAQLTPVFLPLNPLITEIHYLPQTGADREFLEIHNPTDLPLHLDGYRFSAGVEFEFPEDITLSPGEYLLLVKDKSQHAGLSCQVLEWESGELDDGGEVVSLVTGTGELADSVSYSSSAPWPDLTDKAGHSLVLLSPYSDNGLAGSWGSSDFRGGSPCGKRSLLDAGETTEWFRLSIYPSPVLSELTFEYSTLEDLPLSLEVLNALGQPCRLLNLEPSPFLQKAVVDVIDLPAGVYHVRLLGEAGARQSFVKL